MGSIKSITAKMISTILNDDFNVGMLTADATGRNALANVNEEDIDTLIQRLGEVKDYVSTLRTERINEAKKLLESLVQESGSFSSVEELLSTLAVSSPASIPQKASKPNGNKIFEVVIVDSKKDERRTYNVINKKLPAALLKDEVYIQLVKKNPELSDVDEFLRAYSEDYRKKYPLNAKWNGHEFHLNQKGKMNAKAQEYYAEYKQQYPKQADEQDFKELVTKAYKVV
ncbi:hypothetical protein ACW0DL_00690 [Escherichia coli]